MGDLEQRLYNGSVDFTEDELGELVYEYSFITEYGDDRRWSKSAESIIKIEDKLFCIEWEKGLTENQEDGSYSQPYEVEAHEKEVTTVVTTYLKKL